LDAGLHEIRKVVAGLCEGQHGISRQWAPSHVSGEFEAEVRARMDKIIGRARRRLKADHQSARGAFKFPSRLRRSRFAWRRLA